MKGIRFGTKAETLKQLEDKVSTAAILPQYAFTVGEWIENQENCINEAAAVGGELIVRSSSISEDTAKESRAGQFLSVSGVKGKAKLFEAVEQVIASYHSEERENQVLIQPMLKDIRLCGVAFTRDPNTQGDYYVVNYDTTGSTEGITSGSTGEKESRLYYCSKGKPYCENREMEQVITCLDELEKLFEADNLDVEFAITNQGELYVLQVRPLCCVDSNGRKKEQEQRALERIAAKVEYEGVPKPFLFGKKAIYGVMPDWNPAEIIGIRPRPLALSLYREIVTDNIWAYQRDNYGYRNLRSFPLLTDFCGLPYIDVRVSFNSFIPKKLSEAVSEKLVNYYMDRLEKNPQLHDKIEFDIVFSCYTLDLPQRIRILLEHGFSEEEIEEIMDSLKELTNQIINHKTGLWKQDYEKIYILQERYKMIMESSLDDVSKIYWLIEDCKRYGTLPFAGLARAGFIAVQMLKSMIEKEIISKEEYQAFLGEVNTVSSGMGKDFYELSREAFLKKYGHLRPGTYDITSKRYDEGADMYFDWAKQERKAKKEEETFRLSLKQMKLLREQLQEHGITDDILGLFDFIKTAIEGREFAKFIFTKSLSDAIKLFGIIGKQYGIEEGECAYAEISTIQRLYSYTDDVKETFQSSIEEGKRRYELTQKIVLPPLICRSEDVYGFYYPQTEPNYITLKKTSGEVVLVKNSLAEYDVEEKILMIESADPGFDWIFSHNIRGFITKFGGANSHMAIRAAELGIPAAIGTGEERFEKLSLASMVELDAAGKRVTVLK